MANQKTAEEFNIGKIISQAKYHKAGLSLSKDQAALLNRASEIVLALLAAAGITTLAIVAPNALQLVDKLFLKKRKNIGSRRALNKKVGRSFYYLKQSGLIRFRRSKNEWKVYLTELGKKRAAKLGQNLVSIPSPKKWDGKWWLVAADIPTLAHRAAADALRAKLKELGFFPLQRTLWLHPFDPRKEVEFICGQYGIGQYVTAMEINRLDKDDESKLKRHFKTLG